MFFFNSVLGRLKFVDILFVEGHPGNTLVMFDFTWPSVVGRVVKLFMTEVEIWQDIERSQ